MWMPAAASIMGHNTIIVDDLVRKRPDWHTSEVHAVSKLWGESDQFTRAARRRRRKNSRVDCVRQDLVSPGAAMCVVKELSSSWLKFHWSCTRVMLDRMDPAVLWLDHNGFAPWYGTMPFARWESHDTHTRMRTRCDWRTFRIGSVKFWAKEKWHSYAQLHKEKF